MKSLLLTTALALVCSAAAAHDVTPAPNARFTDPANIQTTQTLAAQGNKKAQAALISMFSHNVEEGGVLAFADVSRNIDSELNSRTWAAQSNRNANFEARVATYGYAAKPAK